MGKQYGTRKHCAPRMGGPAKMREKLRENRVEMKNAQPMSSEYMALMRERRMLKQQLR